MRASRGLKWENKMYKLKRSIDTCNFTSECGFPGSRISLKDEV